MQCLENRVHETRSAGNDNNLPNSDETIWKTFVRSVEEYYDSFTEGDFFL